MPRRNARAPAGARGPVKARLSKPQKAALGVGRAVTGGSRRVKKGAERDVARVQVEAARERRHKLEAADKQSRARYRMEKRQARRLGLPAPPPPRLPSIEATSQRGRARTAAATRARYPSEPSRRRGGVLGAIVGNPMKVRGGILRRTGIGAANLLLGTPYITGEQGAAVGRGWRQLVTHPSARTLLYNKPAVEEAQKFAESGKTALEHPLRDPAMTIATGIGVAALGRGGLRSAARGTGETRAALRTSRAARAETTSESFAGGARKLAKGRRDLAQTRKGVRRRNLLAQAAEDEQAARAALEHPKRLKAHMASPTGQDLGLAPAVNAVRAVKAGVKAAAPAAVRGMRTGPRIGGPVRIGARSAPRTPGMPVRLRPRTAAEKGVANFEAAYAEGAAQVAPKGKTVELRDARGHIGTVPAVDLPRMERQLAADLKAAQSRPHTPEAAAAYQSTLRRHNAVALELEKEHRIAEPPAVKGRTPEELKGRLAQLDKAYEELVKVVIPRFDMDIHQKRQITAFRNARRGKRKFGNLKTVNQEVRDAAEGAIEDAVHNNPDLPQSKLLLERQAIRDHLNAKAEEAFGPEVPDTGVTDFEHAQAGSVIRDLSPAEQAQAQGLKNAPAEAPAAPPGKGTPPPAGRPPSPPSGGPRPPAEGPALGEPVNLKVRKMLTPARRIRKGQDVAGREEKVRRMGLAEEAMAQVDPGSHAFYALKGQLKGEYPKLPFENYRAGIITEAEHNEALAYIQKSHLEFWDQVHASQALEEARNNGRVPQPSQIKLLQQVFGKERANTLVQKTLRERGIATIIDAAGIPRSLMASFDVSAPFRQGLVAGARHPVLFFRNFKPMFQSLTSEEAYQSLIAALHDHPRYEQAVDSGVKFTELGRDLNKREEQFISHMADSIPFVHWSGRAYTGFLDKLRMDVFDHQVGLLEKAGRNVEDRGELRGIARYVNNATGRGDLGRFEDWAPGLNAMFFSPRLIASRVNMLNPFWYATLPKFARRQALRSMVNLGAAVTALLGTATYFGYKPQLDPRSADFLKLRLGDSRLDVLGGFQQYMRVAAQFSTGETISTTTGRMTHTGTGPFDTTRLKIGARFLQSKLNPPVSLGIDWAAGTDFAGNPFEWKKAVAGRLTPLVTQDALDLYKNKAGGLKWDPQALGYALVGFAVASFGIGTQTYGLGKNKGRARVFDTRQQVVDSLKANNPGALTLGRLGPKTRWAFNREAERQGLYWQASTGIKPGTRAYHLARLKADLDFIVRHGGYSRAKADATLKASERDTVDGLKATRADISSQYYQGEGSPLWYINEAKKAAGVR